jgi:hypothetical protein
MKATFDFDRAEMGILLSGLDILKENCERTNRIFTRDDKINIKPIAKLVEKLETVKCEEGAKCSNLEHSTTSADNEGILKDEEISETYTKKSLTLFRNNVLTNDPCYLCGSRTDPCGLDYGIEENLVCDKCVKAKRPDLVKIREAAFKFNEREKEAFKEGLKMEIEAAIHEPIEARIMRVFAETDVHRIPESELPF